MGLFGKLFGGDGGDKPAATYDYVPSSDAPEMLQVTIGGDSFQMAREDYRTQVLPAQFQQAWNDPERLALAVDRAMRDEFVPDALEPARQLHRIDPQPGRAVIYLAAALIALKRHDEAGDLLTAHIKQHGESGVILTNLAKVHANKGDDELSKQTLWRGLEADPNQDNGFFWYLAIVAEDDGEAAQQEALRKLAALPASWRPQLWLARGALEAGEPDAAMDWYRQALGNARPASDDMLIQISGDLGNRGHLDRIVELCAPVFDARQHGLMAGSNLIRAYSGLNEIEKAKAILAQMRAQDRPDWNEHLSYWEAELARPA